MGPFNWVWFTAGKITVDQSGQVSWLATSQMGPSSDSSDSAIIE
jgi:hypothetical protein